MKVQETRAREKILKALQRNRALNIFGIADLDDAVWDSTQWFVDASEADRDYSALAFLVHLFDPPIFSALADERDVSESEHVKALVRASLPVLPDAIYGAVTPGIEKVLQERYTVKPDDRWDRMILSDLDAASAGDTTGVEQLVADDNGALKELFDTAFPSGWFHFNFEHQHNYGIRGPNGKWIAAAGTRLFSPQYGVAVVANVMVHPHYRGRGLARKVTAKVCQSLMNYIPTIGLNVVEGNIPAIKCYKHLGFTFVMKYQGWDCFSNEPKSSVIPG